VTRRGRTLRYDVEIVPRHEQYIKDLEISDQAKRLITKFSTAIVGNVSDAYRKAARPKKGKPYFEMRLDFCDFWGDNEEHTVDFVIKDDRAAEGILEIVWLDFH
jgi:hypothetical protein